ncbi:MAG: hypothetical protein SAMD01599839_09300 [Rectinema sp.]
MPVQLSPHFPFTLQKPLILNHGLKTLSDVDFLALVDELVLGIRGNEKTFGQVEE